MPESATPARAARSEGRRVRVLSIDGGGIRGVIPARVLVELEQRSGRAASELFDLIAGTSTGGIIACALAAPGAGETPRWRAADVLELYLRDGPRIFDRPLLHQIRTAWGLLGPRYPIEPLAEVLESRLGERRLTEVLTDVLLTTYDIEGRRPLFFKSTRARTEAGRDVPLRVAALATSAAPTYFPPVPVETETEAGSGVLVDGGVYATNPAMCAFSEVKARDPAADVVLLSLGTGELTRPITYAEARNWGLAKWAPAILDVVFDGVSDTTDFHLQQLLGETRYRRIQVELTRGKGSDRLDDASPENLAKLRATADDLVRERSADLDAILALL